MTKKNHRDAFTGRWTTAKDAAERPAETVSETVPTRRETPDVAELRRKAEAATPGPWEWDDDDERPGLRHGIGFGGLLLRCGTWYGPGEENASYIAAANPAAVLGLLDLLAHMTEARDNARAEVANTLRERLAVVVANHPDPRCDTHDVDDPITCGWKSAYVDMLNALDIADDTGVAP